MKIKLLLLSTLCVLLLSGCSSNVRLSNELEGEIKGMMQEIPTNEINAENLSLIDLINAYRIDNGLNSLELDEQLNNIALIRAKEIVNTFSHTRPDGTTYISLIKETNYKCSLAGENLARYQKTPETVLTQWKDSEGHNANLLGDFTKIGFAVYEEKGLLHYVVIFAK